MAEISNKTLALLVVAALVVVVVTTSIQLNKLNTLQFGPSGFATSGTGRVNLTIASSLNIEVDSNNNTIDFGTCTPAATLSPWIDSNSSVSNTTICNGTAASGRQGIQINNIGNVNANVTVVGECTPAALLPEASGTSNQFQVWIANCTGGTQNLNSYTSLSTTPIIACGNMTTGTSGGNGSFWMYARVKIDSDTLPAQSCGAVPHDSDQLTFSATSNVG